MGTIRKNLKNILLGGAAALILSGGMATPAFAKKTGDENEKCSSMNESVQNAGEDVMIAGFANIMFKNYTAPAGQTPVTRNGFHRAAWVLVRYCKDHPESEIETVLGEVELLAACEANPTVTYGELNCAEVVNH